MNEQIMDTIVSRINFDNFDSDQFIEMLLDNFPDITDDEFNRLQKKIKDKRDFELSRKMAEQTVMKNSPSNKNREYSNQRHQIEMDRIREETHDKTLTSILHTLGVPVPDKLFKDARLNRYAQEDRQSILDRVSAEGRELTEAEDKQVKTLEKQIASTQKAADLVAKLPPELLSFGTALAGAAVAVALMNKAGTEAVKRMNEVNKSLAVLGESSAAFSGTSNLQYNAEQNWKEISNDLLGIFKPVTGLLSSISWGVSSILKQITDGLSFNADDISSKYTGWYTGEMQGENGIVVSELNQTLSQFIKAFKDQGMSNTSASNMAVKLHNLAWNQANKLGVTGQARDRMMNDALSAVISGGGYSEYGWNTSDNVLTGFLNEQGIDNVNVRLTEAMESYYRLMLMQEQQSFSSNDALSKQIRDWEKLGMQIDATKGKLLSFDEELVLSAIDTTIPEYSMPEVENSQGKFGGTGRDISKLITPEDIDNTINKLKEYINTLNLTPEEKQTILSLIDDPAEQTIAAYLDKLGMTPEQILTALKAYQESPEKFIEYLEQQGIANENIHELIQLLADAGVVSEEWADKATQAIKDVGNELDKTNAKAGSLLETLGKLLMAMAQIGLGELAGAGIRLSNKFMDTGLGQKVDSYLEGTWIRDWDKKVADNWNSPNKTKMNTDDVIKNFDILSPAGSKNYRNYLFTGESSLYTSEHIAQISNISKSDVIPKINDSILKSALEKEKTGVEQAPSKYEIHNHFDGLAVLGDDGVNKIARVVTDKQSEMFQREGVPWNERR